MKYTSIDLFSGCGGLTLGLSKAGFNTTAAIEIDQDAINAYKLNHKNTLMIQKDIRSVKVSEIKKILNREPLHLLAGCPPCQGFSTVRNLNGSNIFDERNNLILGRISSRILYRLINFNIQIFTSRWWFTWFY